MRRIRRNQAQVFRKLKIQNSDISWLGDASICKKRHMHYPAFLRNGKLIPVRSFVFIMHEDEVNYYLGYLEDMYEEEISKEKKIQIRWFCHNKEVKDLVTPLLNAHSEEVFITSDVQVIAAEYVDRIGGVLSPSHYDKCLAAFLLPDNNLSYGRTFMCHRQLIKNKKVRPFSMRKLRGYDNQAILSALDRHCGELKLKKLNEARESGEEEPPRKLLLTWSLRNRRSGLNRNCGSTSNPVVKNQGKNIEQFQEPRRIKLVGSKDSDSEEEEEDEEEEEEEEEEEDEEKNIELLCQDSGFRGCWFRCKILETSEENLIKVQYYDVQDSDKSGKLEEWVPESREATPDKLNMRCAGRLTVRPWPPQNFSLLNCSFEIGDAVDAWWGDGWWECVVVGFDKSRTDTNVQVFLPGENKFLSFERKDLRISREWINEEWVEIKGNPEIHSSIASSIASSIGQNVKYSNPKPYSAPNPMMESSTDRPGTSKDVPMQIIKPAAVSVTSNGYATPSSRNCLNPKKRRLLGFL